MVVHSVKWSNSRDSRDSRESGQRKVVHSSCQVNIILSSFVIYILTKRRILQIFIYITWKKIATVLLKNLITNF